MTNTHRRSHLSPSPGPFHGPCPGGRYGTNGEVYFGVVPCCFHAKEGGMGGIVCLCYLRNGVPNVLYSLLYLLSEYAHVSSMDYFPTATLILYKNNLPRLIVFR